MLSDKGLKLCSFAEKWCEQAAESIDGDTVRFLNSAEFAFEGAGTDVR
jgi:hypothetical protein